MRETHSSAAARLPSLDLLKGFEAAARLLSFTRAGEELHLSQSAVSRQIQELEEQLGVALFQRRHRALALTEAGLQFYGAAAQVLATVRTATERVRSLSGRRVLSLTTTNSFASLWLIPRLAEFARTHPDIDVRIAADTRIQNLEREGFDVALRYCSAALAGPGAVRLFGERVFPVCSPTLAADPSRPLHTPTDLKRHTLLRLDDPEGRTPWHSWNSWLEAAGVPELRPSGNLHFSGYEQIIPAAIAGHGVALGRSPLVEEALAEGSLVAPFRSELQTSRAYFAVTSRNALDRKEVADLLGWLKKEAANSKPRKSLNRSPSRR